MPTLRQASPSLDRAVRQRAGLLSPRLGEDARIYRVETRVLKQSHRHPAIPVRVSRDRDGNPLFLSRRTAQVSQASRSGWHSTLSRLADRDDLSLDAKSVPCFPCRNWECMSMDTVEENLAPALSWLSPKYQNITLSADLRTLAQQYEHEELYSFALLVKEKGDRGECFTAFLHQILNRQITEGEL